MRLPTWVELQEEEWSEMWKGMRRPVYPCEDHLRSCGFAAIPSWDSCFWHPRLSLPLIAYVDEFKLEGPSAHLAEGWKLIRAGLKMGDPEAPNMYLGCNHVVADVTLPDGAVVRSMPYGMRSFMESCCAIYLELAPGAKLRHVQTPFLEGAMCFAKGELQICTTCGVKKKKGLDLAEVAAQAKAAPAPQGVLAPIASKVQMEVLYAARMARPDLLKAINSLARMVTRWDAVCDAKLHRLMCSV